MGTILASAIFTDVERILNDDDNVRWTEAELLAWLNAGQKYIATHKPDASISNSSRQLAPGTKQSIAAGGLVLVKVPRNMGADGSTPGNVIRIIGQDTMDDTQPDWHTHAVSATVKRYMFDSRDPKNYYVWPPQPATGMGYVEEIVSVTPADVAAADDPITLDDIYSTILTDYVLYRSYSKDMEVAGNSGRAAAYLTLVRQDLGLKAQAETSFEPTSRERRANG